MISRTTRIQLLLFVIITLVGVSYVGFNYVGLGKVFIDKGCVVHADFPDSGGIFTNADVTYRGVSVGKVGTLHLLDNGVRVDLQLNSCSKPDIPASAVAVVSDRSPVGEQYVNLIPPNGSGPFLTKGAVLPMSRNQLPVPTQVLLGNLDDLSKSIPTDAVQTTLTELSNIFTGRGQDLQQLLDSGNDLVKTAEANLQTTIDLINNSKTVLPTQLDLNPQLQTWTKNLNLLSQTLKQYDPTLRDLLDTGPANLATVRDFVSTNSGDLGVLLGNLASTGQLLVKHIGGVEEIFELYPLAVAGGFTVTPGDGTAHFGLVLNPNDPQDCIAGYGGTNVRLPGDTSPAAPNVAAQCTLPKSSPTSVRGAQQAPGGDPVYTGGGGTVYPRTTTSSTVGTSSATTAATLPAGAIKVGSLGGSSTVLGDRSWVGVLTDGLH